jgi:hypothetical protein
MKKLFLFLSFVALLISCGPRKEVKIPEGTPDDVAIVMKSYNLNRDNAVSLIDALENQSSLQNIKMSDIVSVMPSVIRGNRVLIVNVSGRSKLFVNLD